MHEFKRVKVKACIVVGDFSGFLAVAILGQDNGAVYS